MLDGQRCPRLTLRYCFVGDHVLSYNKLQGVCGGGFEYGAFGTRYYIITWDEGGYKQSVVVDEVLNALGMNHVVGHPE